ncbi:DUF47 family protein [Alicyclobacillaceae bacterium I2511]|nr:DUF47 family protein [Alicyclobacillaceae bacterium I2511]
MSWKDIFMMSRQVRAFHEVLAEQSHVAVQMVQLLQSYVGETVGQQREVIAEQASDLEHDGDRLRIMILDQLQQTFVTPFDREDINDLSRALDDIVDYAENTIKEILIYQIAVNETLLSMMETLQQGTVLLDNAMQLLGTSIREANDVAVGVKACENKMEGIYRRAIANLSVEEDVHYLIKIREVYRHLSNAADRMDAAANVLMRIAIKQAH